MKTFDPSPYSSPGIVEENPPPHRPEKTSTEKSYPAQLMENIYLTDLSKCEPSTAIGEAYQPDHWICYDYETEDLQGKAVFAGPFDRAPDLTLDLNAAGWHHIYIGIHYGIVGDITQERGEHAGKNIATQFLRLRLSSDKSFDIIQPEFPRQRQHDYYIPPDPGPELPEALTGQMVEVYWKTADLTGTSLHFAPWREPLQKSTSAGVAYVRLEPLEKTALDRYRSELGNADTKRVMVVNDGFFQGHHPANESEVRQWLDPMKDSDIALVIWGAAFLDQCAYPTKSGCHVRGEYPLLYPSLTSQAKPDLAFDSLETAAIVAHEMGIELYGSMRAAGGRIPPSHTPPAGTETFFHNHPQYWCVDEQGNKVGHLSLAFPEARQKQMDVLREFVEDHSCDGVHYHFNRCYPFVLFEGPVVKDFQEKYGTDPRKVARNDPRWLEHQCSYLTTFIRDIRNMLDEVGGTRNTRLGLALTVMNSLENNRFHGIDLATWIEEDLVDHLMLHPAFPHEVANENRKVLPETVQPVQELSKGKRCRVYADLYPRYQTADTYRQQAIGFYQAGVYGLAVWDYYWRIWRKSEWNMICRLGHRRELEGWKQKARSYIHTRPLKSLAGMSMDPRYTPGSNG